MFKVGTSQNNVTDYSVSVTELKRDFNALDRDGTDRSTATGTLIRDVIGSFYNYSVTIDTRLLNRTEYDSLYDLITAPYDFLWFEFPYGQTKYKFWGYVASASDKLKRIEGNKNFWGELTFSIVPKTAKRRA